MPYIFDDPPNEKLTLRVVGPKSFEVVHGFTYRDQYDDDRLYEVGDNEGTDLASVPFFLQWLVLSYGRHTNAAIVHDKFWEGNDRAKLREANTAFRHGMWESDVPYLRRWFMWTAVTLAMLGKSTSAWRVAVWAAGLVTVLAAALAAKDVIIGWPIAVACGVIAVAAGVGAAVAPKNWVGRLVKKFLLVAAICSGLVVLLALIGHIPYVDEHPVRASAIALVVGVVAWGRLWVGGVLATVEVVIILLPILAIAVGLILYAVLEMVMYGLLWVGRKVKPMLKLEPVGTLNWMFSPRLEAPTPPPGEVKLAATQM